MSVAPFHGLYKSRLTTTYTSPSFEPFQPRRFLDTPPEIRLMIYEFIVGGNQRIYIKSNLEKPMLTTESIIPSTIIPCSDHSSTGCLPIRPHGSLPDHPKTYCQGTASLSHTLRAPDYDNYQSTTVSYDLQTSKQQIATDNDSSNDQSGPCSDRATYTGRMEGLRILRSCRQIYDEARLVLYNSNTFVFLGFATFATYFGLITPTEVYTSRSTEPNRLRGIQAMTKVGIHGQVGERRSMGYLKFSWASRLIRTGLGCLTSLTSLELNLKYFGSGDQLQYWNIDDCMFSKPSSLRKLVVSIETDLEEHERRTATQDRMRAILSKETLYIAEEIVWRILKQEGFHDKKERLLSFYKSGATTLLMRRQKV